MYPYFCFFFFNDCLLPVEMGASPVLVSCRTSLDNTPSSMAGMDPPWQSLHKAWLKSSNISSNTTTTLGKLTFFSFFFTFAITPCLMQGESRRGARSPSLFLAKKNCQQTPSAIEKGHKHCLIQHNILYATVCDNQC